MGDDDSKIPSLAITSFWEHIRKGDFPSSFGVVLGHPKVPPLSKAEGRFFPQNSGFLSVLQAVWNRAVLCSHSTWLKNVRNVELYFPLPSLPAFSFLTLLS